MKTQDIKNIASAYKQVLEKKLDAVNPDELKGTHAQRKDKDIDNDGDVDKSDEYLHNRRKAIKTAMKNEEVEELDELSKKTLGSYVKKAAGNMAGNAAVGAAQASSSALRRSSPEVKRNIVNRMSGIATATDKLTKEDTDMSGSRWPILQRIMERQNHGNMDNGSPRGEGLSPSAKAELARSEGDSGIDGAKAAADTARNAVAQVKVAPKRPGDKTDGDKTMPKNDGK